MSNVRKVLNAENDMIDQWNRELLYRILGFQDQELMCGPLGFDLCSLIDAYRSQMPWYHIAENIFSFHKNCTVFCYLEFISDACLILDKICA